LREGAFKMGDELIHGLLNCLRILLDNVFVCTKFKI